MHRQTEDIALSKLPPVLFFAVLTRLKAGHGVRAVSRWLMTKHRGPLQHLGLYDIRKGVLQLQDLIDRDEDFDDLAPQLLGREDSEGPLANDVRFQKLLRTANSGRATGRQVLEFVLCTELERLRELHQKDESHGQVSIVLRHVRRIGELLCKLGAGSGTDWEDLNEINIINVDDEKSEELQQLSKQVEQMSTKDRLIALHIIRLYRRSLKLKAMIAAQQAEAAEHAELSAPPPPEDPKP